MVGGGGVGKTTSIFSLINQLEQEGIKVLLCAPTHKACNVLRETQVKFNNSTDVSTLASALGFKQLPEDGKRNFRVSGPSKLDGYAVVIVDESSQVGRVATSELVNQALKHNVFIVGLGDDCQLPPSKEFTSPVFENGRLFELTEVIRYTGDVLVLATELRKHIKSKVKTLFDLRAYIPTQSSDIIQIGSQAEFIAAAIEQVNPAEPDHSKILAWRNVAVQGYNRIVHEAIHGKDAPEYLIGDIILPQAPVVVGKTLRANTDDPCVILDIGVSNTDLMDAGKVFVKTLTLTVKCIRTSEQFAFQTVAEIDKGLYAQAMEEVAQMCRTGTFKWSQFYNTDENLIEVRHPYASTVHKCQGSTFQHNFMDIPDILRCRQSYVTNRLLYTGITRANKLSLLL